MKSNYFSKKADKCGSMMNYAVQTGTSALSSGIGNPYHSGFNSLGIGFDDFKKSLNKSFPAVKSWAGLIIFLLMTGFLLSNSLAYSQTTETFNYTGAVQTWTVPAGVTSVTIEAWGAQGGANWVNNNNYGGYASGILSVTPGQDLNIFVGQQPSGINGGWNGGGNGESLGQGGGGASDIRVNGLTLNDRVIVAGGGGGAGYWSNLHVVGGQGGGLVGGNGYREPAEPGGLGGTQTSGGASGTCASLNNPLTAGSFGQGGSPNNCGCEGYGGGGGWYGGAGSGNCRGGGGGSSYIDGVTNGTTTAGLRSGNGLITITYGNPTCINPTDGGEIAADQTICSGDVPDPFTSISAPTGEVGTLEYQWQISTASPTFEDILGAVSDTYTHTGTVTQTNWFRRLAKVTCESAWVESNVVQVDVDPLPIATLSSVIDDFEDGLPAGIDGDGMLVGFLTWGDNGTTVTITTTSVPDTDPLALPGQSGDNNLLKLDANIISYGGLTHAFENEDVNTWITQDWTSYDGIAFWLYGQNTGNDLYFEVQDNRNPGSTVFDVEIYTHTFTDNFSGWKLFALNFNDFTRKEILNGAPNDGFGLDEVHGWAFGSLSTGGATVTYYMDNVNVYGKTGSATICEDGSHQVSGASAENGTILWSHNGAGSLIDETTLTPTYTPEAGDIGNAVVLTLTVTGSAFCNPATASFTLYVENCCANPSDGGEIAADQTLCSGDIPASFTSLSVPTVFTGDLEYQWQISTASPTFNDIFGAVSDTYTHVGTVTQTTWFRRLAKVTCESTWVESNTIEVSVFPNGLRTWTGLTSNDWNTGSNWDPPCVPTADDDVIIPDVTSDPVIYAGIAAMAKSVTVNTDAALGIEATGSLTINGSAIHENGYFSGLYNRGSMTNDGLIVLGSLSSVGEIGLWNLGTFSNTGEIQIDRSTLVALWSSVGQFTNSSLIQIGASASVEDFGLYNDASFINTADGQIVINNFTYRGLENRTGAIDNSGGITIGFVSGTGQRSIMNQAEFNNHPGGEIFLDRATAVGVYNDAAGLFNNAALLNIGGTVSVGQYGIQNIGTFTNTLDGEIYIDRSSA
ncbi:MAG: hypothetical protein IH598_06275, partial [Bacteroidales bacterium]|nr:hypothetical protein [Bacteroidales bacterium]